MSLIYFKNLIETGIQHISNYLVSLSLTLLWREYLWLAKKKKKRKKNQQKSKQYKRIAGARESAVEKKETNYFRYFLII